MNSKKQIIEPSPENEFYFQWHITEQCNLRCKHCYHTNYSSNKEMRSSQLKAVCNHIFETLINWGKMGSLSLTGGEPFLRESDLFDITAELDNSDVISYYDILTNGTLISGKNISRLTDCEKLRRIQMSLEGACPETNDSIRGKHSFEQTLQTIRLLKKNNLTVSIMMTLSRFNLNEVVDLINIMAEEGVDTFSLERFIPEGAGTCISDQLLTADEIREAYTHYYERGIKDKNIRLLMHRTLFSLIDSENSTVGAMCSIGTNALTIMHDGTVYPCRRLPISLGNILEEGLYKIWYTSNVLWEIRDYQNLKGKCRECEYIPVCRGCRAMAYYVTGDYLAEDPQCWR